MKWCALMLLALSARETSCVEDYHVSILHELDEEHDELEHKVTNSRFYQKHCGGTLIQEQ